MGLFNWELIYTQYCRGWTCEIASENGKGACSSTVSVMNDFKTVSAVGPDVIKLYLTRRFLMEYAPGSSVGSVAYHHPSPLEVSAIFSRAHLAVSAESRR